MLGPTDIQNTTINPNVVEKVLSKDGGISISSTEGTDFLKGKINEILGGDVKELSKNDVELTRILEYAQGKGAETLEDVLWQIRELANRLGSPSYGESRLKFIHQWVFLQNESKIINDKLKKREGYGK